MLFERPGVQITLILILLAASFGVFQYVGAQGEAVFKEFADKEKLTSRFPEKAPFSYDEGRLQTLKSNYPAVARQYVSPILFPFDLAFILIAGGSMLLASFYFTRMVGLPAHWVWLVLVLPVACVTVDLIEDSLLALMLKGTVGITAGSVLVLKALTVAKFASFTGAILATLVLTVWGLWTFARQAGAA